MTYEKVHFNDADIRNMTKKQFLLRGGLGNTLTQNQLEEVYNLIVKNNANNSKSSTVGKGNGRNTGNDR